MSRQPMHLVALAILSIACNITIVGSSPTDDDDDEGSTSAAASSFPEIAESLSGEPGDDSSTGDAVDETTGAEIDGTSSSSDDTTGGVADETSHGESSTSTDTGDLSTTGDTSDETTSSTTDVTPFSVGMGEPCTKDSDCESNVCIGESGFNDQPRCSASCWPDSATSCLDNNHPGLCTWSGGDAYWCTGVFDFSPEDLRLATPDPDVDYLYYQNGGFLPTAAARHAYLVPPQQVAFYIETTSVNDPGYGAVALEVFTSDGTSTPIMDMVEPKGIHNYHWLIVRPAEDQKVNYKLLLKEQCWPNC